MNCYSLMTFFLKGHNSKVGSLTNASRQQAIWQYGQRFGRHVIHQVFGTRYQFGDINNNEILIINLASMFFAKPGRWWQY